MLDRGPGHVALESLKVAEADEKAARACVGHKIRFFDAARGDQEPTSVKSGNAFRPSSVGDCS